MGTAARQLFIGLDMGGTDIKATVLDSDGSILVPGCEKVPSLASDGPARSLEQLVSAADKILAQAGGGWPDVAAVGLGTPGPATLDGVLERSANLKHPQWVGFAVRAAFEQRVGRPVVYTNDCNAAGYWEYFARFAEDPTKILAAAILGTGLGGALVWGGELLVGARGYGGEFGHVRLPSHELAPDGDVPGCGCGQVACAETFVSVAGLDFALRKALARKENAGHPLLQVPDVARDRALRLLGLAQTGDRLALELFDRQADALGLLFVQLSNCFDPDICVVGGGVTESSGEFRARYLARVRESFQRGAFPLPARDMVIELARDHDLAGCRGAALLARQDAGRLGT